MSGYTNHQISRFQSKKTDQGEGHYYIMTKMINYQSTKKRHDSIKCIHIKKQSCLIHIHDYSQRLRNLLWTIFRTIQKIRNNVE